MIKAVGLFAIQLALGVACLFALELAFTAAGYRASTSDASYWLGAAFTVCVAAITEAFR